MQTLEKITQELFSGSSPGGKFLLSLCLLFVFNSYNKTLESKMDKIVKRQNPLLNSENPFSKILRKNTKAWTDAEWRSLNSRNSFFAVLSVLAIISGAWFGFDSILIILSILFNW